MAERNAPRGSVSIDKMIQSRRSSKISDSTASVTTTRGATGLASSTLAEEPGADAIAAAAAATEAAGTSPSSSFSSTTSSSSSSSSSSSATGSATESESLKDAVTAMTSGGGDDDEFMYLQNDIPDEEAHQLLIAIQESPSCNLLDEFTGNELEQMSSMFAVLTLEQDDLLIQKGEDASFFFIVLRGRIGAQVSDTLTVPLGVGSIVGEMSYFEGGVRNASIKAMETTVIAMICYTELEELSTLSPVLFGKCVRMLGSASISKARGTAAADAAAAAKADSMSKKKNAKPDRSSTFGKAPQEGEYLQRMRSMRRKKGTDDSTAGPSYRAPTLAARLATKKPGTNTFVGITNQLQSQIDEANNNAAKLQKELTLSQGKTRKVEAEVTRLEAELVKSEETVEQVRKDLRFSEEYCKRMTTELKSEISNHTNKQQDLRDQLAAASSSTETDELAAEVRHNKELREQQQDALAKSQQARAELMRENAEMVRAMTGYEERLNSQESEIVKLHSETAKNVRRAEIQDDTFRRQFQLLKNAMLASSKIQTQRDNFKTMLRYTAIANFVRRWKSVKTMSSCHLIVEQFLQHVSSDNQLHSNEALISKRRSSYTDVCHNFGALEDDKDGKKRGPSSSSLVTSTKTDADGDVVPDDGDTEPSTAAIDGAAPPIDGSGQVALDPTTQIAVHYLYDHKLKSKIGPSRIPSKSIQLFEHVQDLLENLSRLGGVIAHSFALKKYWHDAANAFFQRNIELTMKMSGIVTDLDAAKKKNVSLQAQLDEAARREYRQRKEYTTHLAAVGGKNITVDDDGVTHVTTKKGNKVSSAAMSPRQRSRRVTPSSTFSTGEQFGALTTNTSRSRSGSSVENDPAAATSTVDAAEVVTAPDSGAMDATTDESALSKSPKSSSSSSSSSSSPSSSKLPSFMKPTANSVYRLLPAAPVRQIHTADHTAPRQDMRFGTTFVSPLSPSKVRGQGHDVDWQWLRHNESLTALTERDNVDGSNGGDGEGRRTAVGGDGGDGGDGGNGVASYQESDAAAAETYHSVELHGNHNAYTRHVRPGAVGGGGGSGLMLQHYRHSPYNNTYAERLYNAGGVGSAAELKAATANAKLTRRLLNQGWNDSPYGGSGDSKLSASPSTSAFDNINYFSDDEDDRTMMNAEGDNSNHSTAPRGTKTNVRVLDSGSGGGVSKDRGGGSGSGGGGGGSKRRVPEYMQPTASSTLSASPSLPHVKSNKKSSLTSTKPTTSGPRHHSDFAAPRRKTYADRARLSRALHKPSALTEDELIAVQFNARQAP